MVQTVIRMPISLMLLCREYGFSKFWPVRGNILMAGNIVISHLRGYHFGNCLSSVFVIDFYSLGLVYSYKAI